MLPLPLILFCLSLSFVSITTNAQNKLQQYSLAELDSLYQRAQKPQEKLPYALKMLEKGNQELDTQDTIYAKILLNIGTNYVYLQKIQDALPYLEKARAIYQVKSPIHADHGLCCSALGIIYNKLGPLEKAEKMFLLTRDIRKEALGEAHPSYSSSIINIANVYSDMGDFEKAEATFNEALAVQKKTAGEKHPYYTNTLVNLGLLFKNTGDYEKAEACYLNVLRVLQATHEGKHPNYIPNLINLGVLYYTIRDFSRAESFYLQALNSSKESYGIRHPYYAKSLNNLGIIYSDIGEDTKAETFFLDALNIKREVLGEKHPSYSQSLTNLGKTYFAKKEYSKAETYYLEALAIQKEILGTQHPYYANNLHNLGYLYTDMGDYAKAESYYLQALELRKKVFGEKHVDYMLSLNNLSMLYLDSLQFEQSWRHLLLAIQSNTDLMMSPNIDQAWVDRLATANYVSYKHMDNSLLAVFALLAKENTATAKIKQGFVCDLALQLLQRSKNELGDENDKLRILAQSSDWVLKAMQVIDKEKDLTKALNLVEQNKSVLILDAASNKRAYISGLLPDSLIKQEKELQKQYANTKADLAKPIVEAEKEAIRASLNALSLEIDRFKKETALKYPKYAAIKYQHESIKTDKIQGLLDEKTALLEYLVGDSIVYIFYVDGKTTKLQEHQISRKELSKRINDMHAILSNYRLTTNSNNVSYQRYTENAWWFYKNLVAPVLQDAKGIERLIIIPDGELGHLPFETFLTKPAPQAKIAYKALDYLIKDYKISYNYSATLWSENRAAKSNSTKRAGQILGMAANYEMLQDSSIERLPADLRLRKHLLPLPAARKEVEVLGQQFEGFFAFDSLASERTFKEKAPEFGIIHLAMHGLLNKKEKMLSSMAFTENNDSSENNFLQAYEIAKMELNADLVVLSACKTGFGEFEEGNGIASLAQSFMYAGVPAIVVSLWEVNDLSTSYLMQHFYDNLAHGLEKDEALRQAKLSYIESQNDFAGHPAFWSPFILMGNESAIHISKKGGWMPWAIGAFVVLFLGGFLVSQFRKKAT